MHPLCNLGFEQLVRFEIFIPFAINIKRRNSFSFIDGNCDEDRSKTAKIENNTHIQCILLTVCYYQLLETKLNKK